LNITINDCLVRLSKADIPGGSVIVVNQGGKMFGLINLQLISETHNLIPSKKVLITLSEDTLSIQGPSRQFQTKSGCKLGGKGNDVQLNIHVQNSRPECKALISLVSALKLLLTQRKLGSKRQTLHGTLLLASGSKQFDILSHCGVYNVSFWTFEFQII
jgi:hypothetical protein